MNIFPDCMKSIEKMDALFNHKTTWIKIAIEAAVSGGELQNAVVRIGDTAGIVLLVALVPNHFLRGCIS